jgi:geranylgeranyl reductase family protein
MMESTVASEFDVVVVGGGPSGSAAAFTSARAGLRTCLVDKQVFPRDKLCGGLLTPRSRALFEDIFKQSLQPNLTLQSDKVSFFYHHRFLACQNQYTVMHFTMRRTFDAYLLSQASAAGCAMRLGAGIKSVDMTRREVLLTDGGRVRYRVLIGADGVNSAVARSLFGASFNPKTIGFALEIEAPRAALPQQPDVLEIDFGVAAWGYGWVFPKQESFTIGVGGIHRLNPDLRDRLAAYLAAKGIAIGHFHVKGHYVPFGECRQQPGRANVLLAGDAAGTVDPITGEGIAYAMQTGRAASDAAIAALNADAPERAFERYLPEYGRAARDIRQAKLWRHLLFSPMLRRPFARTFSDARMLQTGYLDILAGKKGYDALYGIFGRQIVQSSRTFLRKRLSTLRPASPG